MNPPIIQITPAEFALRIRDVAREYIQIAQDYVAIVNEDPDFARKVAECGIPRDFLSRLDMLGREQLDERLLFAASPAELRLTRAPIEVQREVLNQPVPGIEIYDPGHPDDVRHVPLSAMTAEQARIAIGDTGITPVAKQRTMVEKNTKGGQQTPESDFIIAGDKFHFTAYWVTPEVIKKAAAQLKALEGRRA